MALRLVVLGGTIDKEYDLLTGKVGFVKTHIQEMLAQARVNIDIKVDSLMQVDSLDMTENHRDQVLQACIAAKEDRLVITHGTDTIELTSQLLGQKTSGKTIVLTGSMIPYTMGNSDALFNLGGAITAAQLLDPGVYVAMNGQVFNWDNVVKNRELGEFQAIQ